MYYYRLSHELPAKELLKFVFSKCLNSGENGTLFPGSCHSSGLSWQLSFSNLLDIFMPACAILPEKDASKKVLQNSSLVQLTVLFVSPWRCDQASIYKGDTVNAGFLRKPVNCRALPLQSNET